MGYTRTKGGSLCCRALFCFCLLLLQLLVNVCIVRFYRESSIQFWLWHIVFWSNSLSEDNNEILQAPQFCNNDWEPHVMCDDCVLCVYVLPTYGICSQIQLHSRLPAILCKVSSTENGWIVNSYSKTLNAYLSELLQQNHVACTPAIYYALVFWDHRNSCFTCTVTVTL